MEAMWKLAIELQTAGNSSSSYSQFPFIKSSLSHLLLCFVYSALLKRRSEAGESCWQPYFACTNRHLGTLDLEITGVLEEVCKSLRKA